MYLKSSTSRNRSSSDKFPLFAALNFNLSGNKLSSLLKWEQKQYLMYPLLHLHPSLVGHVMKANKLIVDFMDNSDEEKKGKTAEICEFDIQRVSALVKLGCQGPLEATTDSCDGSLKISVEIRDEIYCQLIKQTTGNVNKRSCFRGFLLLLSCLAAFSPSEGLAPFLLSHLHIGCLGGALLSRRTVNLAENCLRALEMIQKLGSRKWGLSRKEIVAIISENESLSMKVWLTKDYSVNVDVDSWTTVNELKRAVCEKAGIQGTSIVTLALSSISTDQIGRQEVEGSLASIRGVMNSSFEHLCGHFQIRAVAAFDNKKGALQSLFGVPNCVCASYISERAVMALDDFLQIELSNPVQFLGGYLLNSSESSLFSQKVYSEQKRTSITSVSSLIGPRLAHLRRRSLGTPTIAAEMKLKMLLVVWIFPYGGIGGSSNLTKMIDTTYQCALSEHNGCIGGIITGDSHEVFPGLRLSGVRDECHISHREEAHRNLTYWPYDEATRNILFDQVVISITQGKLKCNDDTETLRMTALMFAEQHQHETRPPQGELPSIVFMQEIVMRDLDKVLPTTLTGRTPSLRTDTGMIIKEQLRKILTDFSPDSGFGFGSYPNIMGLDCLERTARSKYRSQYNLPIEELLTVEEVKTAKRENQSNNWMDTAIWREFLVSSIVRLWLHHLENFTARECRDEYLSGARECSGYGSANYFPSAVRICILTLQNESRSQAATNEENPQRLLSQDNPEDDGNSGTPKPPIWAAVESRFTSNKYTVQVQDSHDTVAVQVIIELSITLTDVVVRELTTIKLLRPNDNAPDERTDDQFQADEFMTKVLLRVSLDDIISWGYNNVSIMIRFKQRGRGHEESFYSDDNDDDENVADIFQGDNVTSELETPGARSEEKKQRCLSLVDSSVSIMSTSSGCPIYAQYPGKWYKNEYDEGKKLSAGETIESKEWGKGYNNRQIIDEGFIDNRLRMSSSEDESKLSQAKATQVKRKSMGSTHGGQHSSDSEYNRSCDETKQMDKRDSTFVTAASSNVKAKSLKKKTALDDKSKERETESISIDLLNGAEIAEILELYSIHHIEMMETVE